MEHAFREKAVTGYHWSKVCGSRAGHTSTNAGKEYGLQDSVLTMKAFEISPHKNCNKRVTWLDSNFPEFTFNVI